MKIGDLLIYIRRFAPRVVSLGNQGEMPVALERITPDTDYDGQKLLIGNLSQLTYTMRFISNSTLLLVEDIRDTFLQKNQGNTIILVPEGTDLDVLYAQCSKCIREQSELYHHVYDLMEAVLARKSLQEITEILAEQLDNPVMILDNNYQVLSTSKKISSEDRQWQEVVSKGYCTYEYVSRYFQTQTQVLGNTPILTGCFSSPIRRCFGRLMDGSMQSGYILSIEAQSPFDEKGIQYIKMAGKILAAFLERVAKSVNDKNSWRNILIQILEERITDQEMLLDSLQYSDICSGSRYYILIFNMKTYHIDNTEEENIWKYIKHLNHHSISAWYQEDVVVLLENEASLEAFSLQMQDTAAELQKWNVFCTISDWFTDLSRIGFFYRQAKETERLAESLPEREYITFYDDVRRMDILKSHPNHENVADLVGPEYMDIDTYDTRHNTNYFETIYQYIVSGRSHGRTAAKMFVHKNTVSYRINKAKDLFGLNLDNEKKCMALTEAYLLLQMKKKGILE